MSQELVDLANRYIALWNEPDADLRFEAITRMFSPSVCHYTPTSEIHGLAQMQGRVTAAYEQWVAPGAYEFRVAPDVSGHHNAVRFHWHMVHKESSQIQSVGFDFLLLDKHGRVVQDHQFVEP